ncbi:MAG: hypothetical protein LBG81_00530, partial [Coriobacteriaceae bacterium]|nr:hypothetical protein [Coriobacteriaceae bacterium]
RPDTSTFWAGIGKEGEQTARRFATDRGRTTLESALDAAGMLEPETDAMWRAASASYALRSSGETVAYLGKAIGQYRGSGELIGRTWLYTERIILNINPGITSFNGIHSYLQASTLFSGLSNMGEGALGALKANE